jgi:predicted nucleic acid-binding protein
MSYYLDTSALLPYYRAEAHSEAAEAFLRSRTEPVSISALTRVEVASALARWVRAGEIDERQANRVDAAFHEDLAAGRFRLHAIEPGRYERATHWLLARSTSLRTIDALHLACAEAEGAVLVTLDRQLADAADYLGIATLQPS